MNKYLLFIATILLFSSFQVSKDFYSDISSAFQTGKAEDLCRLFDARVDFSLTSVAPEEVYPKDKAENYVKQFLSKAKTKSFTIIHKGASKEGNKFGVGTLQLTDGTAFRVSFSEKAGLLQELHIEKQ